MPSVPLIPIPRKEGLVYAGIGSRATPTGILSRMTALAEVLGSWGWKLRSGGAEGADAAFAEGAEDKVVFRPWAKKDAPGARILSEATLADFERIAAKHHPNWRACNKWARKLHARNVAIVLGESGMEPVDLVVAWTPGGEWTGGTATALRLSAAHHIPVLNFGSADRKGSVRNMKKESMDANPHATRIDRRTVFGNPHKASECGSREKAIASYAGWMAENLAREERKWIPLLASLKGRDLYCHCVPDPCHGMSLMRGAGVAWESLFSS